MRRPIPITDIKVFFAEDTAEDEKGTTFSFSNQKTSPQKERKRKTLHPRNKDANLEVMLGQQMYREPGM